MKKREAIGWRKKMGVRKMRWRKRNRHEEKEDEEEMLWIPARTRKMRKN